MVGIFFVSNEACTDAYIIGKPTFSLGLILLFLFFSNLKVSNFNRDLCIKMWLHRTLIQWPIASGSIGGMDLKWGQTRT